MRLALAMFLMVGLAVPARAQLRDNRDKQLTCGSTNRGSPRTCEVHETSLGPSGSLDIEPGRNGGIMVKGWSETSVLVRARVEAWAESDAEARALAARVRIDVGGGRIRATGPDTDGSFGWDRARHWAVSLEVFTPWNTDLALNSHNGGITIDDLRGRINFQSHNGAVRLSRVAGDITGETHNGAVQVELEGNIWEGRQLYLNTHNGGVTLSLPASFSARVETRSNRGRVDSDFPITVLGRRSSEVNFNIGSGGGPLIRVGTHNGGIRLRRI